MPMTPIELSALSLPISDEALAQVERDAADLCRTYDPFTVKSLAARLRQAEAANAPLKSACESVIRYLDTVDTDQWPAGLQLKVAKALDAANGV